MTSSDLRRGRAVALLSAACGGSSSKSLPAGGSNVVPVSVNGAGCSATQYFNEPCVSVTVCVPGTATCQTVNDVLLDTGSTGLRVFKQALGLSLPAVAAGGGTLGECIAYLDGSSQWGSVVSAGVVLGGEPAVTVPIQLIDSTFASAPSACSGAQTDPTSAGYNGILGVSEWDLDCGDGCTVSNNGIYFACSGTTCAGAVPPAQVRNPVAALPLDLNGVIVKLPAVPQGGAASVSGELVLGIGSRTNNVPPASVMAFPLDPSGELRTTIDGATVTSFLDTGSNGIFFPTTNPSLTTCSAPDAAWFCPASRVPVTAINAPASGSPSDSLTFYISSIVGLPASVAVSSEVGGPSVASSGVDFGLPFHLGRDVYVVIEGKPSRFGVGPIVAY